MGGRFATGAAHLGVDAGRARGALVPAGGAGNDPILVALLVARGFGLDQVLATGQDLAWFFDGYLYQAALPDLRQSRDERGLALEWVTGDGKPFPMPVEVEIDGRRTTVAMPGGRGFVEARAASHILIDPDSKVLRRLDFIEAWKASGGD